MKKVLFVTEPLPYPVRSGGVLRVASLIKALAKYPDYEVHVLGFQPEAYQDGQLAKAHASMQGVQLHLYRVNREKVGLVRSLNFITTGNPAQLSLNIKHALADLHRQHHFDVIQFERTNVGFYVDAVPLTPKHPLLVLDCHDVMTIWWKRVFEHETSLSKRAKALSRFAGFKFWEPRLLRRFGLVLACSADDAKHLHRLSPGSRIQVVPNGVDCQIYEPLPFVKANDQKQTYILFVGNFSYQPNRQAAKFMAEEIMPHVVRLLPEHQPKLLLVGGSPTPDVEALPKRYSWVELKTDVPEIVPYYQMSSLVVAPIQFGTGTRLKILEAMALGRAIVTTKLGCEGIPLIDGETALIADAPLEFAQKVARLIREPQTAEKLAHNARSLVEKQFDWDKIGQTLLECY
jgi:polysaccharide biosynthesis protein PslH